MLFEHLPLPAFAWLLTLTATAAVTDTRTGLIPNWLTLPTLALAPLAQLAVGGVPGGASALAGVLACALVPLAMFGLRALGGGDVKLFAALGALCGASLGLELQLASYVIAAVLGLCAAARRGVLVSLLARSLRVLLPRRAPIPAVGIAANEALTSLRLGASVFAAALALGARAILGTP